MRWKSRTMALASSTLVPISLFTVKAGANPLDGRVSAGVATIQGQNTATVTVNQSSNRAIIDWRTFNIAPGETTRFIQPDTSSVTLNRVTGGLGASTIEGTIKANGGVYIVNPDGILFGPSVVINTGSFLATTHDIANSDFMAGRYNFTISGNPSASIVNQGKISAASGGFAALVAPGVRNDGVITARLGTVTLASGNGFSLDLYGDSLIKLQPGDAIAGQVRDVATGQTLKSLVENTGKLKANGGTVQLSAVAARQVVDSVINTRGVIAANSVGSQGGRVIFGAATSATKPFGAPTQTVKVSGKISAAGRKEDAKGGTVQITGENIQLTNATVNASGHSGGGTILIGGDYHGSVPTPLMAQYGIAFEPRAIRNATTVTADNRTTLNASALTNGNGGKVVVWSENTTRYAGAILATGGTRGGDGGFAEVSGKSSVNYGGIVADLSARAGKSGTILFDPNVDTIDSIKAASIASILSVGTNVIETADQINVNASILKTGTPFSSLSLVATQISIADNVTVGSTAGALNLTITLTPLPAAQESAFYQSVFTNWVANGVTKDDINAVLNTYPNGSSLISFPTSFLLNGLKGRLSDSITSSDIFAILKLQPLDIGKNVTFATSGGTLNINTRADTFFRFGATGTFVINDRNCVTQRCGLYFTPNGTTSLDVELIEQIGQTIFDSPYSFVLGASGISPRYNLSPGSNLASINANYPTLTVSFGAATGVITKTPVPTPTPTPTPTPAPTPRSSVIDEQVLSQTLNGLYPALTTQDAVPGLFNLFPDNSNGAWARPADSGVVPSFGNYAPQEAAGRALTEDQTQRLRESAFELFVDKSVNTLRNMGLGTLATSIESINLILDFVQSAADIGRAGSIDRSQATGGRYSAISAFLPVLDGAKIILSAPESTVNVGGAVLGSPQPSNNRISAYLFIIDQYASRIRDSINARYEAK